MSCHDVKPLTTWINESNQKICRPCTLPVLVQWYQSELAEAGTPHLSDTLKTLIEKPDVNPDEIATELDAIKTKVSPNMKDRLLEFDCAVQVNERDFADA